MAISELENCLSTSEYPPRRRADPLGLEMAGLAELGRAASSAELCVIGWQGRGAPSLAWAPRKDPRFDALGGAALALLANQSRAGEGGSPRIFHVEAAELAARFEAAGASLGLELTAEAAGEESAAAIALVLTAPSRPAAEVEATLALLVRAALNFVMAKENLSSREFWRERARTSGAELARAERHAAQAEAGRRRVDDALAEAAKLKPRDLPAGIGRVVAGVGPFDAWILALGEGHTLRVDASSQPFDALAPGVSLDPRSALFDSFSRGTTILRLGLAASGAPYDEDRLFGRCGFSSYLCIPFDAGVIALAARRSIDTAEAARAEALVRCLAPAFDSWILRREAEARRALVQSLALRLYGAVDAERARIARDLHDDQAQLLAAARIALGAPREKARRLFRELEERLRAKLRALRPATLGRATLKSALEAEIGRLKEAGIEVRLLRADGARGLERAIQNVCYQVAREAVSNVIRHSHARHVELSLERVNDRARLSIADDGRGIRKGPKSSGMGLRGLAERVELIGGSLAIDSRPGRTCVIAEIPLPGSFPKAARAKETR